MTPELLDMLGGLAVGLVILALAVLLGIACWAWLSAPGSGDDD